MNVQLLAEKHLEFLSLNGCCTDWSESTLVKMPHCWKSHVTAHIKYINVMCLLYYYHTCLLRLVPLLPCVDCGISCSHSLGV